MRKFSIAAIAVVALFAITGIAYAANVYSLSTASTSPKGKGSPESPFPTGVKFGYTVKDEAGPRGAPVKTYKIAFQGLTNKYAKNFPKCSYGDTATDAPLSAINKKCGKAKVGTGRIESLVGLDSSTDPNAIIGYCNLQLTLYNLGNGIAIRLDADDVNKPTSQDGPIGCIVKTHRAIQAKFKNVKIDGVPSASLNFDVLPELLHNSGLAITVANTTSNLPKKTTKVKVNGKMKTVGYYSSIGCGKKNKREVRVTFIDEKGVSSNESKKVGC